MGISKGNKGTIMSETGNGRSLKKSDAEFKLFVYVAIIALAILVFLPVVMTLFGEFGDEQLNAYGSHNHGNANQNEFTILINYWKQTLFSFQEPSRRAFLNSMLVSCLGTVLCMYVSALTAYAITAYEWKMRESFDKLIMIIVMIPSTVSTIGFYQMVWQLHMINRLSMLIIPAIASPVSIFFMRLYLKATFSKELLESARIDGAKEFRIFNQIMLPLMKPAIATQAIFTFVASWYNEFVPSIILIEGSKKTIPLVAQFGEGVLGLQLFTFLPPVLVYAFLSRYIVEGIALGGVKN